VWTAAFPCPAHMHTMRIMTMKRMMIMHTAMAIIMRTVTLIAIHMETPSPTSRLYLQ